MDDVSGDWREQTFQSDRGDDDVVVHSSRPYLVIYSGEDAGTRLDLEGKTLTVGRAPEADITVDDREVSKIHCSIEHSKGNIIIEDHDSTNGTYVNGERAKLQTVFNNAVVQVGRTLMKIEYKADAEIAFEDELIRKATTDALTGIPNRRYFERRAQEEIAFARRATLPVGMVMVDIDHFKSVNDTHGHQAGDMVLREIAQLIQEQCREEDLLARYGGEEFVIFLRGARDSEDAQRFCERLRSAVAARTTSCGDKRISVTISVGLHFAEGGSAGSLDELIRKSDVALYRAKKGGRDRVEVYTD